MLVLTGGVWRTYPVLAAAAGSVTAMGFSYLLSKRVTFAEPGVYPYFCDRHQAMRGEIHVR